MESEASYKKRKVISIGVVSQLTGLTERQIRYYEERQLIFPERTEKGNRLYSFFDVEQLIAIANKREDGVSTQEIKQEFSNEHSHNSKYRARNNELKGQIQAHFNKKNKY
ncbi:MerR family transcriptional regulator [Bacillus sp. HMF5848]|uniref:MerR family transcriptional regulator n=1 Tax=Bacillus sp. HMF5848 TaxID=2495421 RepID=UPI000F76713B|nr:MerR family transcriptional regulator [Bacillus sp. HMF5848]RSK29077.1 MerR family transcriptional regulator [Bacillus sp. HMF5848]